MQNGQGAQAVDPASPSTHHLFVVRTWQVASQVTQADQWRGSIEHVPTGRRLFFTKLDQLLTFMTTCDGWQHSPDQVSHHSPPHPLDPATVSLVQRSFRRLLERQDLAQRFYANLHQAHPELTPLFVSHRAEQARKFTTMLTVLVEGLDRFDTLMPILQNLAVRHVNYGVRREHYEWVGTALLDTVAEALAPDFSAQARAAWQAAYLALADTMLAVLPKEDTDLG